MNPRAVLRSLGVIGAALLAASVLGFVLLMVVARWLTPDENARFQALWGVVMAFGSALSVIEQESSRQATRASVRGDRAPASIAQLLAVGGGLAVLVALALLLFPAGREVFGSDPAVIALSFAGIGGFAVQYTVRGVTLGEGDRWRYGTVILLEAAARMALAVALYVGHVPATFPLAAAVIVIGCFGWLPVARWAFRRLDLRSGAEAWRLVVRKVALLGGANGLSSLVLTAFPTLVVVVLGGAGGLGSFFVAVTLTRVPLVLLSPVQAIAVPVSTRYVIEGDRKGLVRLQGGILAGVVAVGALGAAVTALVGTFFYRLFFGAQYSISGGELALLVGATVIIAGALLQAAMLIALERYMQVLITWAVSAASAILCLLAAPGGAQERATVAFVVCSIVACAYAAFALQRSVRGVGHGVAAVPRN